MAAVKRLLFGDQAAEKAAKQSTASQKAVTDRIVKLFDLMLGKVKAADAAGQFSPTENIRLANESSSYNEGLSRGNMAAVNLARGYRPGDSEPSLQDRDLAYQYQLQRRMQDFNIRSNSFSNMLNAYNSVQGNQLPAAAASYGNQAQQHIQMAGDPTAFWRAAANWSALKKA